MMRFLFNCFYPLLQDPQSTPQVSLITSGSPQQVPKFVSASSLHCPVVPAFISLQVWLPLEKSSQKEQKRLHSVALLLVSPLLLLLLRAPWGDFVCTLFRSDPSELSRMLPTLGQPCASSHEPLGWRPAPAALFAGVRHESRGGGVMDHCQPGPPHRPHQGLCHPHLGLE